MEAGSEFIRQVLAALLVLGILVGTVWILRRKQAGTGANRDAIGGVVRNWLRITPQAGAIEVMERKVLTPEHVLHRLQISGREFLVATHPQGCQLIAELDTEGGDSGAPSYGSAPVLRSGGGT